MTTSAKASAEQERTRVLVRIKPHSADKSALETNQNEPSVTLLRDGKAPATFAFDGVLGQDADQASVFSHCAAAVQSALLGINVAILAYGQTGSGKTYSMLGDGVEDVSTSDDDASNTTDLGDKLGILPRSLQCMFDAIQEKQLTDYSLHFSMMQVYNERVFDLLQDRRRENPLQVREGVDEGHTVYVQGLSEYRATSRDDVMTLLHRGMRNRAIRATEFNQMSSRSHMIFQARLQVVLPRGRDGDPSTHMPVIRRSTLTFVDLAGSEKWRPAQSSDATRELTNINTSLSALANCISAIVEPGRKHIPFRDSVLTRLLQDTLGGTARSLLLATVQSDAAFAEDTYSTLQFAARAAKMTVTVAPNELLSDSHQLVKAKREIQRLKRTIEELQSSRSDTSPRRAVAKKKHHASNGIPGSDSKTEMDCADCKELQSEIGGLEQALASTEEELRAEREFTASLRQEIEELRQQLQQQAHHQVHQHGQTTFTPQPSATSSNDRSQRYSPIARPNLTMPASPGFKYPLQVPALQVASSTALPSPTLVLPTLQGLASSTECPRHRLKDCVLCRIMKPADRSMELSIAPLPTTSSFAQSPAPGFRNECALHGLQACMLCQLREGKQTPSHQGALQRSFDDALFKPKIASENGILHHTKSADAGKLCEPKQLPSTTQWQHPPMEPPLHGQLTAPLSLGARSAISEPNSASNGMNYSVESILDYSDAVLAEIFGRSEDRGQSDTTAMRRHKQKQSHRARVHDSIKPKKVPTSTKSPYAIGHVRN